MELVTIKMKATARGSEFGWDVSTFEAGRVYRTTPDLAAAFLKLGVAEYSEEEEGQITTTVQTVTSRKKRR